MKTLNQSELEKLVGKERVVQMCDGRHGVRNGIHVKAGTPADANGQPIIDFISSDATLDRYDEVVVPGGCQLANYQKNPVFQNCHQYGDIIHTIGKALITEIRPEGIYQRVLFAVDINPIAKIAYGLYQAKILNAVSIGFIPIRYEIGADQAEYRRKYLEWELLETSAVGIPANPNALQMGIKSGAIAASDVRELADFLKQFCSEQADPKSNSRSQGAGVNGDQLLQLTKQMLKR